MAKPSLSAEEAGVQITRDNISWNSTLGTSVSLTFGFRDFVSANYDPNPGNEKLSFEQFNADQIAGAKLVFDLYADVANLTFTFVDDSPVDGYTNNATILLSNYHGTKSGPHAFAYFPHKGGVALDPYNFTFDSGWGDVWYSLDRSGAHPVVGDYDFQTLLHEIGHTLGLQHPGNYDGGMGSAGITYKNSAEYREDSLQYTNMSYFEAVSTGADHTVGKHTVYASTLLLDDITAIQRLYGANTTTRTGDDTYGFNSAVDRSVYHLANAKDQFVVCVWDAGGTDTLDFSGYHTNQLIDLNQGAFSNVGALTKNFSIAFGTVIENANGGSGADRIFGNAAENQLVGNAGDDQLFGRGGNDELAGNGGKDRFIFDTAPGAGNLDTILDFSKGDHIVLDRGIFGSLGKSGALAAGKFALVGDVIDANDRVIFDPGSHVVYFDPDGSDVASPIEIAVVNGALLKASSFLIVA